MRKDEAFQVITAGGVAVLVSLPAILLTAASLPVSVLMACCFGAAFVVFAMAFGPLWGIIFGMSIIALLATAVTGLLDLSITSSLMALYGPYVACFMLAILGNVAEEAFKRLRLPRGRTLAD